MAELFVRGKRADLFNVELLSRVVERLGDELQYGVWSMECGVEYGLWSMGWGECGVESVE